MRTRWIVGTAVIVMSVTAAVGAQSTKAMPRPSKSPTMTYTGCVEAVNHGGWFLLTNVHDTGMDSMHGDMATTGHDDMAMKKGAEDMPMKTGTGTAMHEPAPMSDEKMGSMASRSFALAGATNLSRHAGQKVSVTGSLSDGAMGTMHHDVPTLTIKTLKVIGKSCS